MRFHLIPLALLALLTSFCTAERNAEVARATVSGLRDLNVKVEEVVAAFDKLKPRDFNDGTIGRIVDAIRAISAATERLADTASLADAPFDEDSQADACDIFSDITVIGEDLINGVEYRIALLGRVSSPAQIMDSFWELGVNMKSLKDNLAVVLPIWKDEVLQDGHDFTDVVTQIQESLRDLLIGRDGR